MLLLANLTLALLPQPLVTTWYVDVSGTAPGSGTQNDPYTSIQYAIDQATTLAGDTLLIETGDYEENVDLRGKDLILDGSAADPPPRIHGQGSSSTLSFVSGESALCVIRDLFVVGGTGTLHGLQTHGGGAFVLDSSPTFEGVQFVSNEAHLGGGVAVLGFATSSVAVSFSDCSFRANSADEGGGLWVRKAGVFLHGGEFGLNHVSLGNLPGSGAGLHVDAGGVLEASAVRFDHNRSITSGNGGGAAVAFLGAATFTGCEFVRNEAPLGGGVGFGGGVYSVGTTKVIDCTFQSNGSSRGGGVAGNVLAEHCWFQGNFASDPTNGRGGAADGGVLRGCTLIGNSASTSGGGAQSAVLEDCDVLYNEVWGSGAKGGGLAQSTATDCRLVGNTAQAGTGAPSQGGGARGTTLVRCVVNGNWAQLGGGTYAGHTERATVFGNRASRGSAVHGGTHDSSILWNNGSNPIDGAPQIDYSCIAGGYPGVMNIDLDPLLFGPAGSDAHPRSGSPVIDAGNPSLPPDPDGSPADMGALALDAAWSSSPAAYCRAGYETFSCIPRIGSTGVASLSGAGQLMVTGSGIYSDKFGVLFVGLGDGFSVLGDSVLCVGGPLTRLPVQAVTGALCEGSLVQPLTPMDLVGLGVFPGERIYAQWAYRNVNNQLRFTDALEVPIVP